jgi:hypothetical protein
MDKFAKQVTDYKPSFVLKGRTQKIITIGKDKF